MSFFSGWFLIFFVLVFIILFLIPVKFRHIFLLIASWVFYGLFSIKFLIVLLFVTAVSYLVPVSIKRFPDYRRILTCIGIVSIALVLLILRIQHYFRVPVGISFYSLLAIGYIADVYSGKAEFEHSIVNYGLFVSFFPCVLSGPIERSTGLLEQIKEEIRFSYDKAVSGVQYVMWGYFLKTLIADRISVIVDNAFSGYSTRTGAALLIAVILYGVQLLADFSGYSYIAIGIGRILGFSIADNFRRPYFSESITEFWKRWHISLSSWLRDYVYIPLGGNRKGRVRQYLNLMVTFLISGIWHGLSWNFLVWGGMHGIFQILSRVLKPLRKKLDGLFKPEKNCFSYRLFRAACVFIMVDFAWLFFRVESLENALRILRIIFSDFRLGESVKEGLLLSGYRGDRFIILLIEMTIWLVIDIITEMDVSISEWINKQNRLFRWTAYTAFIVILIMGAIYNYGLGETAFIYAKF